MAPGSCSILELAPLNPPTVSALLAGVCGGEPGPRLGAMAAGASGNPLYVTELAAALVRAEAGRLMGACQAVDSGGPDAAAGRWNANTPG